MRTIKQLLFLLICLPLLAIAQNNTQFTFEDSTVPTSWDAKNGTLSLSTEHYKEGVQSLCWKSTGESVVEVVTRSFSVTGRATALFFRSPACTNDLLKVEFIDNNGVVQRTSKLQINFKGWRDFIRSYAEYPTNTSFQLNKVRFTLTPTDNAERTLYFDNVNFNSDVIAKNWGTHCVLDYDQLKSNNYLLSLYANPIDIAVTTPTAQELAELEIVRGRLKRTSSSPVSLFIARNYVNKLKISRNSDGSVKGGVMDCSLTGLTVDFVTQLLQVLETLASKAAATPSDAVLLNDLVDHMLDQGFAEGTNYTIASNAYGDARYIPSALLNIVPVLSDERKVEVLKLVRWLSEYGTVYYPKDKYLSSFNSDLIYNYLPHMYGYALLQPDTKLAVREMKAMKRYMDRHTEVVPGTSDMLKIDGTGFHHATHYNNYMYAYKTWVEYVCYLKGTSFNVSKENYPRLRKAILSTYVMANKNRGNNHFWANSLAGRNPYTQGGVNIQVPKANIEELIIAGGTILGTEIDEELAAAYNYFFDTNKYDVSAKNYDGYYQFNYSPLGIYRKGDWVAAMRAPTSKFWGAEIYNAQNRLGRYQSHGSLEIVYTGDYARSGLPVQNGAGGWDWNVVPGTTTVHYTSWREMMPGRTVTDRFDQRAKEGDFSGALAFNNCGVFASDFVQGDDWGSQRFTPTNLKFKKSVFTFDSLFVCLGNDISAVGNYGIDMITATNLFQEVQSTHFKNLIVNGSIVEENTLPTLTSSQANWVVTPLGTGYFIPSGNDKITLKYGSQTSPKQTGVDVDAPTTTVTAVKAYLEHGSKPTNKNYSFVVVPGTSSEKMAALANSFTNDATSLYTIEAQTTAMHAVSYKPLNATGYTFFQAVNDIAFGDVKSTTTEHLLMVKKDLINNRLHIAASNPNLRPKANAQFGFLSTPTVTTLTLRGAWKVLNATESVGVAVVDGDVTRVIITLSEGEPTYFTLGGLDDTSIDTELRNDWVIMFSDKENIRLNFDGFNEEVYVVSLYSSAGVLLENRTCAVKEHVIAKNGLASGMYVVQVKAKDKSKKFKVLL